MGYGIPFTEIYNRFLDSRSFSELKLMGRALSNAELLFGGEVVCSQITAAEIAELGGGSSKELDAIVDYLKGDIARQRWPASSMKRRKRM